MKFARQHWLAPGLLLLLVLNGCSTAHYRRAADASAYQAIKQKSPLVRNMDPHFTIEETNLISLAGLPLRTNIEGYLGPEGERERNARVLKLEDALDIAVHHSRSYQSRKEDLYLSALALNFARHQFTPIFSGNASANYVVQT